MKLKLQTDLIVKSMEIDLTESIVPRVTVRCELQPGGYAWNHAPDFVANFSMSPELYRLIIQAVESQAAVCLKETLRGGDDEQHT